MTEQRGEMRLNRAYPDVFSTEDSARMAQLLGPAIPVRGRERLIRAGEVLDHSMFLCSGFLGRYSSDRLGRRQFVSLQIPGDYVDLPAYLLKSLDHDIDSLGPSVVRPTAHAELDRIGDTDPELYRKLWRISMIDAAIQRYWVFRIGRLPGKARLANFFCEMFLRLFARGLADPQGFVLPTSQADLAEICGMTSVHVNRLLAELRLDGICTIGGGRLEILDLQRMFRVGQHSRGYLYLPRSVEEQLVPLLGPARDG